MACNLEERVIIIREKRFIFFFFYNRTPFKWSENFMSWKYKFEEEITIGSGCR